jgi:phosphatidylglycerol:prolipoprotein diacylglycerol transferase
MNPGPRVRFFAILGAGAIGLFIYSRVVHLSFRRLLDVFALPTLTGLMIHRVGCYLAGCCWGDVVDGAVRGVQFPPGSLAYEQHGALGLIEPGAVASLPVYPVQIYEAVLLAALLLILIQVPWRRMPRGTLAILAIAAYAVMRFFIEYLRADAPVVLGNLTVTQLQCIILAFSIVLLPRLRGRVVS